MRPTLDEWFLRLAEVIAQRSTCARRAVGCVLIDTQHHVLATGYNGVPRGVPHCNEGYPCPSSSSTPGTNLDGCFAVHAEQNALLQCPDTDQILTCYTTVEPCVWCTKLLLNTSCLRVVFLEPYAENHAARELWASVRGVNYWQHHQRSVL